MRAIPIISMSIRSLFAAALLGLVVTCTVAQEVERHFRVGITSFRDKGSTLKEWQPTIDFLEASIPGARFDAVALNMPEFEAALVAKRLDFLITNPQHYIAVEHRFGVSRIATIVKRENGVIVNQFGGVVFTRSDQSGITALRDLKGKRIAATDKTSFAGYQIQADLLRTHGLDPTEDCQISFLGFPQDLSVLAVLSGKADAGFVRSGLLESMVHEGKLDLSQLRVLNPVVVNGFPFLLSSRLFPEWPLAAAPHVPVDVTNRVVAALLMMPPDSPAAKKGRYYRWSTPVEYQTVEEFMRRTRVYPFDKVEPLTWDRLVHEYGTAMVIATSLVCLFMVMLYWRVIGLNRELLQSRQILKDLAHFDSLTGLPNRNLLDDRLEHAIAQVRRQNSGLAVCLLDLDGFKLVNDQFGHEVGDRVLKDAAQRIKASVRDGDTVARFGGDEFVVIIDVFHDESVLTEILQRINIAACQGYEYCPQAEVSASIGVSIYGRDAMDATTLLRHADEAMYLAKKSGGNRHCLSPVTT
jgi:diguanylate cyclase (GGDEF)-like protein